MRLAYVAGPCRSKDGIAGVKRNIDSAMAVSRELWRMGFASICPHGNSAYMDGPDIPDQAFLDGDTEMLRRCDLIVLIPGWESSVGAVAEFEFCQAHRIPMFLWPRDRKKLARAVERVPIRWPGAATISPETAAAVLGKHAAEVRRQAGPAMGNLFEEEAA